jgi:hypothetical protein
MIIYVFGFGDGMERWNGLDWNGGMEWKDRGPRPVLIYGEARSDCKPCKRYCQCGHPSLGATHIKKRQY